MRILVLVAALVTLAGCEAPTRYVVTSTTGITPGVIVLTDSKTGATWTLVQTEGGLAWRPLSKM